MRKLPKDPRRLPSLPVTHRDQFPVKKGLYWGIAEDEILYIGMTADPDGFRDRWKNHDQFPLLAAANAKVHFWSLDLSAKQIGELETAAIRRWWPPLNKAKKSKRFKPHGQPHRLPPRYRQWLLPALAALAALLIIALG